MPLLPPLPESVLRQYPVVANKHYFTGDDTVLRTVYIGRPSTWGNPWTHFAHARSGAIQVETREEALARYDSFATILVQQEPDWLDPLYRADVLLCWCKPAPCHGDILVRLMRELDSANQR